MRHVAAYLLASLSGEAPSADKIKEILGAVGVEADETALSKVMSELEGKDLQEVIAEGTTKLASVPSGGGRAAAGGAAPAAGGAAAVEEEKEEEKESSEDVMDGGMSLFDDE
eukprot:Pgem_evm1s11915